MRLVAMLVGALMAFQFISEASAQDLPIIIGHRGASGYLPEHTLEAYMLAIEQGAHFIEPDLVITKDGILIARHENALSDTTDVAEKFPDRKAVKIIDGREVEDWFSEDFTLAEIKTLRAKERLTRRNQSNNGQFQIPTFEEVVALARAKSAELGRDIGVYPETKHPSYFASLGLPLEPPLVDVLQAFELTSEAAPVFIQSFEFGNLQALDKMIDVRLVQLLAPGAVMPEEAMIPGSGLRYAQATEPEGLAFIATYADGIGPWKGLIVPPGQTRFPPETTSLIDKAHAAGLIVHAYTFRSDDLAQIYGGDPAVEYKLFFSLGLDGVFTDYPDHAVAAAAEFSFEAPSSSTALTGPE